MSCECALKDESNAMQTMENNFIQLILYNLVKAVRITKVGIIIQVAEAEKNAASFKLLPAFQVFATPFKAWMRSLFLFLYGHFSARAAQFYAYPALKCRKVTLEATLSTL